MRRPGWKRLWRRRRDELRSAGVGLNLAEAGQVALEECRCRSRIAEVIGKPAALDLSLMVTLGEPYSPAGFVIMSPLDFEVWKQLAKIPCLQLPIGRHSNF